MNTITLEQAFNTALTNPENFHVQDGPLQTDGTLFHTKGQPNWSFVHADMILSPECYSSVGFDKLVAEYNLSNRAQWSI